MIVGIGIDHCEVDRMRKSLERWGDRILKRVFCDGEIAYASSYRVPAERYAARFAAKEATLKAIGTGIAMGINWREVEVIRHPGSAPQIALHGRAAEIAKERGAKRFHLAITHTGDLATAVVVAE